MRSRYFGELPQGARFYLPNDQQEYEKIPLTQVGEHFPTWPQEKLANRSLSNYRIPDAARPDEYFAWLASDTLVLVEEE